MQEIDIDFYDCADKRTCINDQEMAAAKEEWLIEANCRATQLDINPTNAIPLKTVMQKARQLIKKS